jgi:pyruvate dehydrogenase E2 component (dihydrolipoamide acetyltransferase)
MAKVLEMPKLSPTMTEGQLTVWHKKEGDAVGIDDLLAEVETDKAMMEFRSFDKGTLLKLLVPTGSQVLLGQPVAILGNPGEDISSLLPKGEGQPAAPAPSAATPPAPAAPSSSTAPATTAPAAPPPKAAPAAAQMTAAVSSDGRVRASPYVRKIAREREIDLAAVPGSGPGGRIIARDLESVRAPAARQAPASAPVSAADELRPLSMMRKTIARRLTESKQNVPHFYLTIDVDAGPIARLREQINADLAATAPKNGAATSADGTPPVKISVNDLLIKASAIALVRVPDANASYTPDAIVIHHRVDISVAVAIPEGLVTPVVRQADKKSIVAIAQEVRELAARAKAKKLRLEEMADGTFSISNLGMFGIDSFSAVINPPEGAILAVGRIRDEPVVSDGAVVPGQRLALTLSCDHRVVDGALGARYLAELRTLIERPTQMLVF